MLPDFLAVHVGLGCPMEREAVRIKPEITGHAPIHREIDPCNGLLQDRRPHGLKIGIHKPYGPLKAVCRKGCRLAGNPDIPAFALLGFGKEPRKAKIAGINPIRIAATRPGFGNMTLEFADLCKGFLFGFLCCHLGRFESINRPKRDDSLKRHIKTVKPCVD